MQIAKLSLVLIDYHDLFAKALSHLLSTCDFTDNVATFKTPRAYFRNAANTAADVIIYDIRVPEMNSIDLLLEMKQHAGDAKLIVLTSITEPAIIRNAIHHGTNAYLTKDIEAEELKEAILCVCKGENYIGKNLRSKLQANPGNDEITSYNLSPREKEVLFLVCSGMTIREAASEMQLSFNTVQAYYKSILKKFNIKRTTDLIVFAIQHGLYTPKSNTL